MKLYIPTTTLNFNNLFASESISPWTFYARRNFGYLRFTKIKLNNLENSILLYSKLPIFTIPKSDYDDYPMIIEIDVNDCDIDELMPIKSTKEIDIYQCNKTIYFNPFSTRIFFMNEQHKSITHSKSESSLETKLTDLYCTDLLVFNKQVESIDLSMEIIDIADIPCDDAEIEKDKTIDRIKGFAYCYLIGANKSLNTKIIGLKKYYRELNNIVASIVNSSDGHPSENQKQQLKSAITKFNALQLDNFYAEANEVGETSKAKELIDWFSKKFNLTIWQKQLIEFDANDITYDLSAKNIGLPNLSRMKYFVNELENKYLAQKPHFFWKNEIIAITSSKLTTFTDNSIKQESQSIYQSLINDVFTSLSFSGKEFNPRRLEFSKDIVLKVKEELGDKWEGSIPKEYLNKMLKTINGEDVQFQIKKDKSILQDIAVFCFKGEDIDKLEDLLINNEIADYRLAFGFYGALFGFASLPKTLTNDFFDSRDKKYIVDVYKTIFKQLHTIQLHTKEEIMPQKDETLIERLISEIEENITDFQNISEINKSYYKGCIRENYKDNINIEFINNLKNIAEPKGKERTKAKWNKVITFLKKKIETPSKLKKLKVSEKTLFEAMPLQQLFYCDANAWNYIESLIIDPKGKKQVKEDLDWFQNNYNEYYNDKKRGIMQKGIYYKKPKDNQLVIQDFRYYLYNKKNNNDDKLKWLQKIYFRIDIDSIIQKLQEIYKIPSIISKN